MKFKSNSGYSLIEIGIAIIIIGIFMVCSMSLLSASNENYRRIEQRNIALSYAMQAMEAVLLEDRGLTLQEIKNKALIENNMIVQETQDALQPRNGKNYGDLVTIVTVNVEYKTKSKDAGNSSVLTLQSLKVKERSDNNG